MMAYIVVGFGFFELEGEFFLALLEAIHFAIQDICCTAKKK